MTTNNQLAMGKHFKNLNLLKKVGLSLFIIMFMVYLILSVKFILS